MRDRYLLDPRVGALGHELLGWENPVPLHGRGVAAMTSDVPRLTAREPVSRGHRYPARCVLPRWELRPLLRARAGHALLGLVPAGIAVEVWLDEAVPPWLAVGLAPALVVLGMLVCVRALRMG